MTGFAVALAHFDNIVMAHTWGGELRVSQLECLRLLSPAGGWGLRFLTLHPNTLDPGRTGHRAAGRNPSLFEDPQLSTV